MSPLVLAGGRTLEPVNSIQHRAPNLNRTDKQGQSLHYKLEHSLSIDSFYPVLRFFLFSVNVWYFWIHCLYFLTWLSLLLWSVSVYDYLNLHAYIDVVTSIEIC